MQLISPALQQAWEKFEARHEGRTVPVFGIPVPGIKRHQAPLRLAYVTTDLNKPLYMLVRYCEGCMRGYPLEVVRELPDGTPDARELHSIGHRSIWNPRSREGELRTGDRCDHNMDARVMEGGQIMAVMAL